MATKINDTKQFFVFTWTIRPITLFGQTSLPTYSPSFTVLQNNSSESQINWRLGMSIANGYVVVSLYRLEDGEKGYHLKCEMSLVNNYGLCMISDNKSSIMYMKNELSFNTFVSCDRLFLEEKDNLVPNDELTLRCTIWLTEAEPETTGLCFAVTDVFSETDYFFWPVEKFSSLEKGQVRTFLRKPNSLTVSPVTLKLFLAEDQKIQINVTVQDPTYFISTYWSVTILNALGQTVETGIQICDEEEILKFYDSQMHMPDRTTKTSDTEVNEKILNISLLTTKYKLVAQRDLFLPNDVLILKFRPLKLFSGKILFDSRQTEILCRPDSDIRKCITGTLTQDMENLFKDGSFSDFDFLVASQKFPVHKAVLSARSRVFKAMLSTDMKEKNQTSKELSDIDAKTLHQLLLYIYTDTIGELQFKDTVALYSAADMFELISLKNICSSLLKADVCVSNVCEILVLSDMHSDGDLKRFAQDFILDNGAEVLRSDTWKNIRKHHTFLASETAEYMFLKKN